MGHALAKYLLSIILILALGLSLGGSSYLGDAAPERHLHASAPSKVADKVSLTTSTAVKGKQFSFDRYRFVAHALGGVEGLPYCNCREGFLAAYQAGVRLFEVDLTKTSDNQWVCRHSWTSPMDQWEEAGTGRLSLEEFLTRPLYGRYQPLSYRDLITLAQEFDDAYFILDTKHYSVSNYQSTLRDYAELMEITSSLGASRVLDRFIPQIYNESMFYGVAILHSFPGFLYSCWQSYTPQEYERIAAYCKSRDIQAVSIEAADWTEEVQQLFDSQGIYVYVYTVNSREKARSLLEAGVTAIISDYLSEEDMG